MASTKSRQRITRKLDSQSNSLADLTPSSYKFVRFEEPFLDAGLAFLARELEDLFSSSVTIEADGFNFTLPESGWEEKLFSRLVEQRHRRLMQTPAKSNRTGKSLVSRPLPGIGHKGEHPVFGKLSGVQKNTKFISLIRQVLNLECSASGDSEVCGVTGQAFLPHEEIYKGRQFIYPFMADQKQNLGGVRAFDFRHNQKVILAGVCAWLASVPFAMYYKNGSPVSIIFYPVVSDFSAAMDLEQGFARLLAFDHSPFGNFRVPGKYSDSPFAMLIRLYERYYLDTSRVLPCNQWFVLRVTKEDQGYDIRAFDCSIPSLSNFNHFFTPMPESSNQEHFALGNWLGRIRIKALDDQFKDRYDDVKDCFPEWLDNLAMSFLEDNVDMFIASFAKVQFGHSLYIVNTTRDEFFKIFWILIDRFSGGKTMDASLRHGVEAFGRALESFAWHGRSGGGRKDLSHHYKIARSGSYRALAEAVTDAISGMMAASDASGTKFKFNREARQFCEWWVNNLDSDYFSECNWWKVKSLLVAAMNMAVAQPQTIQPDEPQENIQDVEPINENNEKEEIE